MINKSWIYLMVVRHWHMLTGEMEMVEDQSFETFKVRLDEVLGNLIYL